jgi:hypothetical protein
MRLVAVLLAIMHCQKVERSPYEARLSWVEPPLDPTVKAAKCMTGIRGSPSSGILRKFVVDEH